MSHSAFEVPSFTGHAVDLRADGATRMVHIDATNVTIERVVQGIRMRIGVPIAAYRDLQLAVRATSKTATLRLRHDDPDLDVELGCGEAINLAREAKGWSERLGHKIAIDRASVDVLQPIDRRTKRAEPRRRSSFARRRRPGDTARLETSFASEHEIIARD